MGDGDAGVGGPGDGAGDAWDDLKADTCGSKFRGFFRPTAKKHRVATFEPGDSFAFARQFDDESIDLVLSEGMGAGFFADVDALCAWLGIAEEFWIAEVVIDEDVCGLDAFFAFDGEQSGIARASADEVADARSGFGGFCGHDRCGLPLFGGVCNGLRLFAVVVVANLCASGLLSTLDELPNAHRQSFAFRFLRMLALRGF